MRGASLQAGLRDHPPAANGLHQAGQETLSLPTNYTCTRISVGAPLVGALVLAAKGSPCGCPYKPETVIHPQEIEMWVNVRSGDPRP